MFEVFHGSASNAALVQGRPDVEKVKPYTLSMPDGRYWSMRAPRAGGTSCAR